MIEELMLVSSVLLPFYKDKLINQATIVLQKLNSVLNEQEVMFADQPLQPLSLMLENSSSSIQ